MQDSSELNLEPKIVCAQQINDNNKLLVRENINKEDGELFSEQYEILDELGKGTYGVVRKVKNLETGKYYAAKFLKCGRPKEKKQALDEIDILNCLKHPKLLELNAAFVNHKEVIMVTELITGGELYERVVAKDFSLTEKDCIIFTRQICEGVEYMHRQNIVHLDLKPENILCRSRTSHQIKIIDFGLAQKIHPTEPIRVLCGTAEFVSPEIVSFEPIGLESDIWSVGVICYVLLSGKSPFRGANKAETYTNISTAKFNFDHKAFDSVSQDSKDFINGLLIKTKEDRLTAMECLKHKWLAQDNTRMSCMVLCTDELKKFIIRRRWHVMGNVIRALGRMNTLLAARRHHKGGCCMSEREVGKGAILQKFKMASLNEEEVAGY